MTQESVKEVPELQSPSIFQSKKEVDAAPPALRTGGTGKTSSPRNLTDTVNNLLL